jgi:hypothetical protein
MIDKQAMCLRIICLRITTTLLCLAPCVTAGAGELQLRCEEDRVVAEGASPGSDVVLFAVMHGSRRWQRTIRRIDRLLPDQDNDGTVELMMPDGISWQSIWAAVDTVSGAVAIATPTGASRAPMAINDDAFAREGAGAAGMALPRCRTAEVLLVEPGLGAWSLATGAGTRNDADGAHDGVIHLGFPQMQPLFASGAAPDIVSHGAVIVVIDATMLQVAVGRVGGELPTTTGIERGEPAR